MFLETSEEQPSPELYQKMLNVIDQQGVF
jgi:muramoyltetrapeptide carboxypeptidase LdcA involved in peptidoglycan recycling